MSNENQPATALRITLESSTFGGFDLGPRKVHIRLPLGYHATSATYPATYFSDGGIAFSGSGPYSMDVDLSHDRLVEEGLIDPVIFVGISHASSPDRTRDLTPTVESGDPDFREVGGGLEEYYRFIAQRLKPYIDAHYRTQPHATATGIAGASLGGLAALLLAYEHPETFGMAGCMSSSFGWDHGVALRRITEDGRGYCPVRIWVDGGGKEYDVWRDAARVYALLERRGWTPGDDLAAYFDYDAAHEPAAQRGRMREMLLFLLRKRPLTLASYHLVRAIDVAPDPAAPTADRQYMVGAEAWYDNGLRLTVPQPDITASDSAAVTVDSHDPLLLRCLAPATISSTYRGHAATLHIPAP